MTHDHSKRKALDSARLKVEHNGNKHELNFVTVDQRVTPLLGLKSCQGMGLIKIMIPGVHAPVNNVAATPEKAVSERKLYRRVLFQILSLAPSLIISWYWLLTWRIQYFIG